MDDDPRAQDAAKKLLEAACVEFAAGGVTSDPYLVAITKAQKIHQVLGIPIWPWETDQVPDDWMDAIDHMTTTYPKAWKEFHPTK